MKDWKYFNEIGTQANGIDAQLSKRAESKVDQEHTRASTRTILANHKSTIFLTTRSRLSRVCNSEFIIC